MTTTENLFSYLNKTLSSGKKIPPVEKWNPEKCGKMDLVIKANGEWCHQGKPILRKNLFQLFSTVLRRDQNDYFLVTPVEKIDIQVEWQPFVILDFEVIEERGFKTFVFLDNCENQIFLREEEQIKMSAYESQLLPVVKVRRNLFASFSRSCYYRLIERAETSIFQGKTRVEIGSNGCKFLLGEFSD